MPANTDDFFGEGVLAPQSQGLSLDEIAANEEAKRRAKALQNQALGLDANGNPLPAYGTPLSQGGTATGFSVSPVTLGARDAKPINGHPTVGLNKVTGIPGEGADGFSAAYSYENHPGGTGTVINGSVGRAANGGAGVNTGADALGSYSQGGPGAVVDPSLDRGNALADEALGTQPTVDPTHQVNNSNINNLTPVVDPSLAENDETDRALSMSQDLVDRVLNTPLQTKQLADEALSNQLLVARSARGGAGATQSAMDTALGQAPELLRAASQQSINEQVTRAGAAGQAASIYAGVAGNSADRAVRIAQGNQAAGLSVMSNLTALTGQDLQFDQAKMATVGQLARDYFNNAAQFANMSTQLQIAQWANITQKYGIDKNFDAAVKKIAADENIGPLDAFKLLLGGAAAAGSIAAGA